MSIILDCALGVSALVAVIVGLVRGFSKTFSKLMCRLLAIFAAVIVTSLVLQLIKPTEFYLGLTSSATGWFEGETFSTPIATLEDLQTVIAGGGILSILGGLAQTIFDAMQAFGVNTLGAYLGILVIDVISSFVLWLVCYLAIKYILYGIKFLLEKIAQVPVFKTIDKIFGLLFSLVLAYVIVVGVVVTAFEIVTIMFLPDLLPTLQEAISSSTIFGFVHSSNIIGSFIASMFGVDLSALGAMVL